MAAHEPSLKDELESYNHDLDCRLRGRYGMTLKSFKVLKATTQLVGAAAGIYAMQLGAPPLAAFALVAIIISGPESLEYLINES
jgi:hypothetical protein